MNRQPAIVTAGWIHKKDELKRLAHSTLGDSAALLDFNKGLAAAPAPRLISSRHFVFLGEFLQPSCITRLSRLPFFPVCV
jgi:hypothetical protein